MNNITTDQQFLDAQLAILDLPPVERKRNLLELASKHGLEDISRHYHSGSVHGSKGEVQFPYLNIQVKGIPASGSGFMYTHGGVHMRAIEKNKPALYLGTDDAISTLEGWLDRKFGVELKTIQASNTDQLYEASIVTGFMLPRTFRVSDELTKWDYVLIVTPNSEKLQGSVRQGLRRKLRKHENEIIAEYFVDKYFEELLV